MKLIRDPDDITEEIRCCALSIGNFDGVHLGHARIIERLTSMAREVQGPAVVFTFDPHPVRLLRPELVLSPLTRTKRKSQLLSQLGVQAMIAYPTDGDLLNMSPAEFFQSIVVDRLGARAIVEGPNFFFGKDRQGDIRLLDQLCESRGIKMEIVDALQSGENNYISSSRIRELIGHGNVRDATQLLTAPYRIRGMVTHGVGRGVKIGFPTANLEVVDTLMPAQGVYAGRGFDGTSSWPAAINIGPNPTFGESAKKVEVHLIGFEGTLYGQPLEVDFLARLRDIQTFGSIDELTRQLAVDVDQAVKAAG